MLYGAAGVVNDFTMWLVVAIVVARLLASGWRRSAAVSVAWAVVTVWLYLLVEALVFGEGHSQGWGGLVMWTVLAAVGGLVGGLIAASMDRYPVTVAPLALLCLLRLRDPQPWHNPVGLMHHGALVLVLLWCLAYWTRRLVTRQTAPPLNRGR